MAAAMLLPNLEGRPIDLKGVCDWSVSEESPCFRAQSFKEIIQEKDLLGLKLHNVLSRSQ
jgi:hypothetical protein